MASGGKSVELRAGLVVLGGIVILIVGLFLVSGGFEAIAEKKQYTILFPDAGGIGSGDTVLVAGQRGGEVRSVVTTSRTEDGVRHLYIAVTVEIYADLQIPVDSRFWISKSITNIVQMHVDYGTQKRLADAETELHGTRLSTFDEVVDASAKLLGKAEQGIDTFNEVLTKANQQLEQLDVVGLRKEVSDILASVKRSTDRLETIIGRSDEPVARILANIDTATAKAVQLTEQVNEAWPRIDGDVEKLLEEARAAAADLRTILADNREPVKALVQNLNDAVVRLTPLLERMEEVSKTARDTLVEVRPLLVKGMDEASQAVGNFKDLTEDLKVAPWKLLNKPSKEEADVVLFYNAARLYIESAAEVNRVIQQLNTLRELGVLSDPARAEMIDRTLKLLEDSLKRFQENQDNFAARLAAFEKK